MAGFFQAVCNESAGCGVDRRARGWDVVADLVFDLCGGAEIGGEKARETVQELLKPVKVDVVQTWYWVVTGVGLSVESSVSGEHLAFREVDQQVVVSEEIRTKDGTVDISEEEVDCEAAASELEGNLAASVRSDCCAVGGSKSWCG